MRDAHTLAGYGRNILGARSVIPRLLDLFAKNRIACTWATVGMLFYDNREALLAALPSVRPSYANPKLSADLKTGFSRGVW